MERAAAHTLVADLDQPTLSTADQHHLQRVLRLAPGSRITCGDGQGRWRPCVVWQWSGDGRSGRIEPMGEIVTEPRPAPPIGIAFALTKGERPEWTVQKLTELGVDSITPMVVTRSVVRLDGDRAGRRVERWRRVAREAAMQSRRAWLPQVEDIQELGQVSARPGAAIAEEGGGPPSLTHALVLVGPEGGWTEAELDVGGGLPRVDLGPLVLRAETAALTAGAILAALRSGLVHG